MRPRTMAGILMLLSSFAFFGGGAYVLSSTVDMMEREERQRAETERQCVTLVKTIPNATITQSGSDLTGIVRNVTDPRKAMTDATVAALMCPGKALDEVCLGDGCEGANGEVVLRFKLKGNEK